MIDRAIRQSAGPRPYYLKALLVSFREDATGCVKRVAHAARLETTLTSPALTRLASWLG
jgi:hypothetical protein